MRFGEMPGFNSTLKYCTGEYKLFIPGRLAFNKGIFDLNSISVNEHIDYCWEFSYSLKILLDRSRSPIFLGNKCAFSLMYKLNSFIETLVIYFYRIFTKITKRFSCHV